MKKHIQVDSPVEILSERIRKHYFKTERTAKDFAVIGSDASMDQISGQLFRRSLFILLLIFVFIRAAAPGANMIILPASHPVEPFARLIQAIGIVETMGDELAYNELENAVGVLQIRQVRVDDYNRRTGSTYTLADMFNYEISEKVFLYFASLIGPYDFERIARAWNGSGPMTALYWERIKKHL